LEREKSTVQAPLPIDSRYVGVAENLPNYDSHFFSKRSSKGIW